MIYCVVPKPLADELYPKLVQHYEGEDNVTVILDRLAEGATRDEVLAGYPSLRADHISAALAYAAELAREERLVPIRAM